MCKFKFPYNKKEKYAKYKVPEYSIEDNLDKYSFVYGYFTYK